MVNNNLHDQLLDPKYTVSAPVKQRFEHSFSLFLTVPCYSTISPSKHCFTGTELSIFAWPTQIVDSAQQAKTLLSVDCFAISNSFFTKAAFSRASSSFIAQNTALW
jgi:hypothetical protein